MARARWPIDRNQMLPPTTAIKAARIISHGRMLNARILLSAAKGKKEIERYRGDNPVDRPGKSKPKLHNRVIASPPAIYSS